MEIGGMFVPIGYGSMKVVVGQNIDVVTKTDQWKTDLFGLKPNRWQL